MRAFLRVFVGTTVLSTASALFAQQPTVVHGQVTTEAADRGLGTVIDGLKRQKDTVWVGYSVPVVSKFGSGWTSNHIDYLEGNSDSVVNDSEGSSQSSDHAVVLLRIADSAVTKLRVESPERELDAGGLRFVWLNGVNADDSVRVLTDLARQDDAKHLRDSAVFAISVHQTNAASPMQATTLVFGKRPRSGSQASAVTTDLRQSSGSPVKMPIRSFAKS
jgi:hypothetical protein